ncbi:MAG TPA: hypothetical protein VK210_14180 [Terriglobia bacterium]|nr:hypothetical protein [Terriglobia bacterium]
MRLKASARSVFLNCPFDSRYENLYLALIAGTTALGLTPRSVLEIPTTEARLTRLVDLISQCDYSIHDLSRVQLSGTVPRCPRFNMPFELGLAVAVAHEKQGKHHWIILEAVRHRLLRSLSDLNGFDPFVHGNTVSGVLGVLTDAFEKPGLAVPVAHMRELYRLLRLFAVNRRSAERINGLYRPSSFRKLVVMASRIDAELRA